MARRTIRRGHMRRTRYGTTSVKTHPMNLQGVKPQGRFKRDLKEIIIERREGPIELMDRPITVKSFSEADSIIRNNAYSIKHAGYDKHDVVVRLKDGKSYKFRYDVSSSGNIPLYDYLKRTRFTK